jgi:phosphate transport system protein
MAGPSGDIDLIDYRVTQLFALVSEVLAGATHALLSGEAETGQAIVDGDKTIDNMTQELTTLVWKRVESGAATSAELRQLVGILLILPELERSADLGEHIAQRAVVHLGRDMSPLSRGLVQRMSEVALQMWRAVADAYARTAQEGIALNEADEELDELHERLTLEVAKGPMPVSVASQVTLVARFYERLGDHAVNLARRIDALYRQSEGPPASLV